MNYELINETIGLMDFDLIEAADEAPQSAGAVRVTPFVKRPWLKWAAAAVAIAVIAAGTPLALKAIGSFRSENFVAPNGGNSGIVAPVDSSESDSSEPESSSEPDSENNASSEQSGESRSRGSEAPSGSSAESPDDPASSSETPSGSDVPEQPEGDFVKDNMPAVTYRINGEYKTFDYQSSTAVVDSGSSYVIDRYVGSDGSTVSVDALSGGLMRYDSSVNQNQSHFANVISKKKAVEIAKSVVADTDIAMDVLENADISDYFLSGKRYITFAVEEGKVEVCLDKKGGLCYLVIDKKY
ncbi:MAG: hypothetical protein J5441_04440 [Clostridia bacterium]|nr:hypothetical protein [Clostridia bacterium]